MTGTLVAGFGNVLRGDDGFGVAVIRLLQQEGLGPNAKLLDVGTGGIHLAYELLVRYDRVIIVDAMTRGGPPGTLYSLEVTRVEPDSRFDLHLLRPARALGLAKALGVLPPHILMIGCEPDPASLEELALELSAPVAAAAGAAVQRIGELLGWSPHHV